MAASRGPWRFAAAAKADALAIIEAWNRRPV
jgi:hypothetical protein